MEGTSMSKGSHLYLVLDDWSLGYSIRKINLLSSNTRPQLRSVNLARRGAICTGKHSLPSPFFCFQAPRGKPKTIVSAFDNKILARLSEESGMKCMQHNALVFDIHDQALIRGPEQWNDMVDAIYIPVGDRLFALNGSSFDMLPPPLPYDDANWKNFVWSWSKLPKPTFQCDLVSSYAVHPDGRSIFVSTVEQYDGPATFSCDVVAPATDYKWRWHGPWQLPFSGRGYFDPELDAWVGLSRSLYTIGHICACDVVATNTSHQQCPALKLSKEKLFSEVPSEKHIGATLVYMGGGSRFCLLETIYIKATQLTDSDEMSEDSGSEVNKGNHLLRLTTFSLKYDENGDLTTGNSRCFSYYSVPHKVTDAMLKYPVAFWM